MSLFIDPPVLRTAGGTPYLRGPGVAMIASTRVNRTFFSGDNDRFVRALFPSRQISTTVTDMREAGGPLVGTTVGELHSDSPAEYFADRPTLSDGVQLLKFAGQLCYLSFGEGRSYNKDAGKYLENIKMQQHGSVFEHYNVSLLIYGCSRAFTHELVRHRAGFGFSQVSQRYVAGRHLRFVEGLETQNDPSLHDRFERWIEASAEEYQAREEAFLQPMRSYKCRQCGQTTKSGMRRTDEVEQTLLQAEGLLPGVAAIGAKISVSLCCAVPLGGKDRIPFTTEERKLVRQAARRCLPNEAEAPILVTGNLRAWRHMVEQRASRFADAEAARNAWVAFQVLSSLEPALWEDYSIENVRPDGIPTLNTKYRKV